MKEDYLTLGVGLPNLNSPWVLVIGGVSKEGNRRARRASREAAERGLHVLWIDGYEEEDPQRPGRRLPLSDPDAQSGSEPKAPVLIIGFRDQERNQLLNRLSAGRGMRDRLSSDPEEASLGYTKPNAIARFARKLNLAVRGYFVWRRLRSLIRDLGEAAPSPPDAIVYCDDFSVATAWHAVRQWPEVPSNMVLPQA